MNANSSWRRPIRQFGRIASILVCVIAAQAAAQSALDLPSLTIPAESQKSAEVIKVTKTAIAGGFEITVANHGADKVTGIVVAERAASIPACPAANPVTITGGSGSESRFTIADLTGTGITLGTLSGDQIVTLSYSCGAK